MIADQFSRRRGAVAELELPRLHGHAADAEDPDHRRQRLPVGRGHLNLLHHVHAADDAAEGGEALAVGVALAAEVELRLIADADEELVAAVSGPERAIESVPSMCDSPVTLVRSSGIGGKKSAAAFRVRRGLDDLDLDRFGGWLSGRTVRWNRPPS